MNQIYRHVNNLKCYQQREDVEFQLKIFSEEVLSTHGNQYIEWYTKGDLKEDWIYG